MKDEPLRILVADDNRDAADSLAILLRLWGHEVSVAYDGQFALALADDLRPHVILLDICMSPVHGGEVARQLRSKHGFEKAVIIATSANNPEDSRLDAWRHLFDLFLTKPYNLARLESILAEHARCLDC
jgi:CheY-like chemotaxis protein